MDSENLISLYFCGQLNDTQSSELAEWLKADKTHIERFVFESAVEKTLYDLLRSDDIQKNIQEQTSSAKTAVGGPWDESLWDALLQESMTAPTVDIPEPAEAKKAAAPPTLKPVAVAQKSKTSSLFILGFSLAALILLVALPQYLPEQSRQVEVATLQDSVGARWDTQHTAMKTGLRLRTRSDEYRLDAGFARIAFDNNTIVTIEGPAQFEILAEDQIALEYGKVYLSVPTEAYGFTVSTPTAKIIDLGTEFGVRQGMDGNTDLHVISGKTMLATVGRGRLYNTLVTTGAAKRLFKDADQAIDIPLGDRLFVRQIDSRTNRVWRGEPVDLADIVGGGNGFGTGNADFGINYPSGQIAGLTEAFKRKTIETTDIPVPASPFIDRTFYPNANGDPVQLSSNGHRYAGFPKTEGHFWGRIHNGAWAETPERTPSRHRMQLNGVTYGTQQHPAITMHPNQGITFDLDAIRKSLDGLEMVRFESLAGTSQTAMEYITDPQNHNVDIWVLVDGQERFVKRGQTAGDAPLEIAVEIRPEDRFLSLAVTDGQDSTRYDWALFARPRLAVNPLPASGKIGK